LNPGALLELGGVVEQATHLHFSAADECGTHHFTRPTCLFLAFTYLIVMKEPNTLPPDHISAIIQMALSDHVSFANIQAEYGVSDKQVKTLMRDTLKSGSYRAWRKRVRQFGDRRETYK
jgi:uncharacterized protein (TIGR03643 family)